MKKFLIIFFSAILLCGCTKQEQGLSIQGKIETNGQTVPFTSYISGSKWRTEYTKIKGVYTVLYDGNKLYAFGPNAQAALTANIDKNEISSYNPINPILDWENGGTSIMNISKKTYSINQKTLKNTNINGYDCQMKQYAYSRKACINKDYNIATFLTQISDDGLNRKIAVDEIGHFESNEAFKLPRGLKVYPMENRILEAIKL